MRDSVYDKQIYGERHYGGLAVFQNPPKLLLPVSDLQVELEDRARLMEQVEAMMNQTNSTMADVIIIGSGPGGYVAAIRAAQLGGKVVLIEKDELGGVCLNRGCIPTKAMLSSADVYDTISRRSSEYGVNVSGFSLDYGKVRERRDKVVKTLVSGVGFLMKKNKVQVLKGTAKLTSKTTVEVTMSDGKKESISGRNIMIATGSEPVKIPVPGLEGDNVWDSDGALNATAVPKSILIVGGGAIGVEWGYMFHRFGAQVTIVELMSHLLPLNDSEIAQELQKVLQKSGIKILMDSRLTKVEQKDGQMVATVATGDSEQQITSEKVLVAVGRRPVSTGLGIEELGIQTDRGKILVNDRMQTNVSNIYAIGDVVGGMLLAHKASEEGVVASENCMGHNSAMNYRSIPAAVYTTPEVANVGITENYAKDNGINYKVGKFTFFANGKALGIGENAGMVKFITDAKYGEILGCHMVGPHVTDLIQEVVIGMDAEATIEVLARAVHGHPTLSEVVKEAALAVNGEAIHG